MSRVGFWLLISATAAFGCGEALAQSGVVSGSPQVLSNTAPSQPPNQDPSPSTALPSSGDAAWIAVAGGFREGRWVRVGFARRATRGEAEIAAIESCNGGPGGVRCSSAHATSSSCLYIVPGKKRGGVTWGRGATPEVALRECRRGGYQCNQRDVIGGCPDRPS